MKYNDIPTPGQAASKVGSTRPHNPWREICAASIGNALEFYDLLIYGYFAIVIGKQFFPSADETTSLLLSVASFAVSFVTRPLGAIVLGSYADKAGRKASLTVSITLMMLGTAIIAIVPGYAQIGIDLAHERRRDPTRDAQKRKDIGRYRPARWRGGGR